MRKYLFPAKSNFYKANLHVHTTVSDGEMTPEEIKKVYSEKGYSIVAFTDHEVMVPHPELTDEHFLALTSTEISVNNRYDCDFGFVKTYHLNIYSPREGQNCFNTFDRSNMWLKHSFDYITAEQEMINYDRSYSVECINDIIKKANDEGCLVSYNHPVWSLQDYMDYIDIKGLWGIELYNTGCARNGYFDSEKPFDDLLRKGERLFPLATDDAHRMKDCFGGFVMVNADELTYDKVFESLKNGDFYCSTAPELYEISIEGSKIKIVTSPVAFVGLSTDCRQLYSKGAEGAELLTEVSFDLDWYFKLAEQAVNEHRYIRITLVDEFGNKAFSRAYHIDEIS